MINYNNFFFKFVSLTKFKIKNMKSINIHVKLTLNEYIKAIYYLSFTQLVFKIVALFSILYIISIIKNFIQGVPSDTISITFGLLGIIIPISIYFTSKRTYYKTRIDETMIYTITDDTIRVKGETFESIFTWDKIYKVSETRSWILIWQTKITAKLYLKKILLLKI